MLVYMEYIAALGVNWWVGSLKQCSQGFDRFSTVGDRCMDRNSLKFKLRGFMGIFSNNEKQYVAMTGLMTIESDELFKKILPVFGYLPMFFGGYPQ